MMAAQPQPASMSGASERQEIEVAASDVDLETAMLVVTPPTAAEAEKLAWQTPETTLAAAARVTKLTRRQLVWLCAAAAASSCVGTALKAQPGRDQGSVARDEQRASPVRAVCAGQRQTQQQIDSDHRADWQLPA